MPTSRRRPPRRGRRPPSTRPSHLSLTPKHPRQPDDGAEPELIKTLRRCLRSDQPLDLLMAVSGLLAAVDERRDSPLHRTKPTTTLADLVESFIGINYAETTAALSIIEAVVHDHRLKALIGEELQQRHQPMPAWIRELHLARIQPEVSMMTDVLGDGDDYLVTIELANHRPLTALIYVDHNLGGVVKDAFLIPEDQDSINHKFESIGLGEGQVITTANPADARAIIEAAISHGTMMYPPLESETWPMCRPLVEWMVRMLPGGGTTPLMREWSEQELEAIAQEFLVSPFAKDLTDPDYADLLDSVLWFASGWSGTDPFRWSQVRVEILLTDWYPRKIMADVGFLSKLPTLLRAYIRYCQDRLGIPKSRRQETLKAIDEWEPTYQQAIRSARLQGPEALIDSMMSGLPLDVDALLDDKSFAEIMLSSLERSVGGRIQLMQLDDSPLPDEPFIWDGIPKDIHPTVQQVLDACDRVAMELFDVEYRTAMRRLLGRVAVGDPLIFRRKASPARGAAAIGWLIMRANDEGYRQRYLTQEVLTAFGVSGSVSGRAEPMLRAIGIDPHRRYGSGDLGATDLLTSQTRASMITRRDRYLSLPEE